MRRVFLLGGLGLVGTVLALVIGAFIVFAIIARPRSLPEPGIVSPGAAFDTERAPLRPIGPAGGSAAGPQPPTTRREAPPLPSGPVAAFAAKVAPAAGVYAQALAVLDSLGAAAGEEPSLLRDQEWRAQATFVLKMMELAAEDMASVQPVPPELSRTGELLQEVNAETKPMVADYASAIDTEDQERIAKAAERLDKINEYLLEAAEELRQAAVSESSGG